MSLPAGFIYWPDTCHPSLERHAPFVRAHMAAERYSVRLPKIRRPVYASFDPKSVEYEPGFDVETLDISRATGPAPYVGRPFRYIWNVAIGEGNRWIAGPAEIWPQPEENPCSH